MEKIYIAGCGGMLGEAFYKQFAREYKLKCTDIDVNEKWLSYCDFRIFAAYRKDVLSFKPDYLFHLGALTDLEYCELYPDKAYVTNSLSVENAAHIANELDIPLLYITSAGVFDGNKDFYDDWDIPNPVNHYGRSKYVGELFVKENVKRHLICRAGWMMGGGPDKDKKFVRKILGQIKEGKKQLHIVNDKFGTPTYTHDFAKNVRHVLRKGLWGVYNMACIGETSRLDVTREILRILRLTDKIKVIGVDSDFFKKDYFAVRPVSERLINKKLILRNLHIMQDWKTALRDYLDRYYTDFL